MSRPFAAFDIDGTVIRWQLYHAIADSLRRQGFISEAAYEPVRIARSAWKQRNNEESFKSYEQILIEVFDSVLKGLPVFAFESAAQTVMSEYKEQQYTFTRQLIADLKKKNYLLFAVSASPDIIIQKLANYYEFDDYAASSYPQVNGYYTGEKELLIGKKEVMLQDLLDTYNASEKGSIAIGDSSADIQMLAMVERPIAFNPDKELYQHARSKGWEIVVERKNMVYHMQAQGGNYVVS